MRAAIGKTLADHFGGAIPICGIAGDQQAAAIGQACSQPGDTKATYGTGAFVLTHAGDKPPHSRNRLLGDRRLADRRAAPLCARGLASSSPGSMMQWLRDQLGLIGTAAESEAFARSVADSAGVCIVPAFTGLGAPHWDPDARGAVLGLTLGASRAHIVRAALEAIANQTFELQRAFAADGAGWSSLRIDGGMVGERLPRPGPRRFAGPRGRAAGQH